MQSIARYSFESKLPEIYQNQINQNNTSPARHVQFGDKFSQMRLASTFVCGDWFSAVFLICVLRIDNWNSEKAYEKVNILNLDHLNGADYR